jgi:hypothetical protein
LKLNSPNFSIEILNHFYNRKGQIRAERSLTSTTASTLIPKNDNFFIRVIRWSQNFAENNDLNCAESELSTLKTRIEKWAAW